MNDRTDLEWLQQLRGEQGKQRCQQAYSDLAEYLYRVSYYHLNKRRSFLPILKTWDQLEMAQFAQDFVQITLEKLARGQAALLDQFHLSDRQQFKAWAAKICIREIDQELRKSFWQRRNALPLESAPEPDWADTRTSDDMLADHSPGPELAMLRDQVLRDLDECISSLPERQRDALTARSYRNEKAEVVATRLNTTANNVYQIVFEAKNAIRSCMTAKGWDAEILGYFAHQS